jgi:hypothetical protein
MATPVVPSQFAVGKNRIIHKPTTATFSFETGQPRLWRGRSRRTRSSAESRRASDICRQVRRLTTILQASSLECAPSATRRIATSSLRSVMPGGITAGFLPWSRSYCVRGSILSSLLALLRVLRRSRARFRSCSASVAIRSTWHAALIAIPQLLFARADEVIE